jgi:hypothetical protein
MVKFKEYSISQEVWSFDMILKLNPYQRNRDVDPRIKKVSKILREKFVPTQLNYVVGRATGAFGKYNVGDLFVLDGNTRCEVYRRMPELIPPYSINVTIYELDNLEDANNIYYSIDSSDSVETSMEKVTGLHREQEYQAISKYIRGGKYRNAVGIACLYLQDGEGNYLKGRDYREQISFYWEEIKYLDSLNLDLFGRFSSIIFAVFLLLLKKYGIGNEQVNLLLMNYKNGITTVNDHKNVDGVHHVYYDMYDKNKESWRLSSYVVIARLIGEILYSLDSFVRGVYINKKGVGLTEVKLRQYFQNYI